MTFQQNAKLERIRQLLKKRNVNDTGLYVIYDYTCYKLERIRIQPIEFLRFGDIKDYELIISPLDKDMVAVSVDVSWSKEQLVNAIKTRDELLQEYPEVLI